MKTSNLSNHFVKLLYPNVVIKLFTLFLLSISSIKAQPYYFVQPNNQSLHQFASEISTTGWISITDTTLFLSSQFLQDYMSDLGLGSNDSLAIFRTVSDSLSLLQVYHQYYKNIKVEGGELSLHSKDNQIFSIHGKIIDSLNMDVTPAISLENALDTAFSIINASVYTWEWDSTESYPIPELVLAHTPETAFFMDNYVLCYKILINAELPQISSNVYINANTGNAAFKTSNIHTCNGEEGTGETNFYGTQDISIRHRGLQNDYILEDCDRNYATRYFDGGDGNWSTGANLIDNDAHYHENQNTSNSRSVTAHWSAGVTHDIYKNVFGLSGMGGNYNGLNIYVWHENERLSGPKFQGKYSKKRIFIGAWTLWNTLDVMAHEWTHGVIEANSGGMGFGGSTGALESGALNESFCDIFGKVVEWRESTEWSLNGIFHPANPEVDFTWQLSNQGGNPERDMSDPHESARAQPKLYQEANFWCTSCNSNHTNSGVQNYWFYLLSEGHPSVQHLTGIGIEKASLIAYRNMVTYIQDGSEYEDSRLGSIQAAREIFGRCSEEDFQNTLAWDEVNLGQVEWCAQLSGPKLLCLDNLGNISESAKYRVITPDNAQITWIGLDPSWTYNISGANGEILIVSDFGNPSQSNCVNIKAIITFRGQTKLAILIACFENCGDPYQGGGEHSNISTNYDRISYEMASSDISPEGYIESNTVEVYPNPVNDIFYIQSDYKQISTYIIFNTLGQDLQHGDVKFGLNLITPDFNPSSGVYMIKIIDESGKTLNLTKMYFNN